MRHMNMLERLKTIRLCLDKMILPVTSVIFVVMILIVFLQVVARYVFGSSLSWSEEIARFLLVWTIFLAAGYTLGQGSHIFLDVVFNSFPRPMQKVLRRFSGVMLLGFSYVLTHYGFEMVQIGSRQTSSAVGVPMWLVYSAIPVGGILLIIYCLFEIILGQEEIKA